MDFNPNRNPKKHQKAPNLERIDGSIPQRS